MRLPRAPSLVPPPTCITVAALLLVNAYLPLALAQSAPAPGPSDEADSQGKGRPRRDAPSTATSSTTTSSGSLQTVVITGSSVQAGGGLITPLDVPKSASLVSEKYIKDQSAGANPFQLLNMSAGVNSNGRGASGLDRGQISVRGFQSNQLGLSLDGVPINDSGTFNTFPQEYVDTENLSSIAISQGAGDADSPNIGATGGVITMLVKKPSKDFHFDAVQAFGSNAFRRTYLRVDTGTFGNDNRAFLSFSDSAVDQWRGIGSTWRKHVDAMLVHDLSADDQLSLNVFYNKENMAQYEAMTKIQIAQYGYGFNFAPTFTPISAPTPGVPQSDNNSTPASPLLQRSNFNGLQYNPFENVIVSAKASLGLRENVHLEIQPYLWFGRGNGGGGTYVSDGNTALLGQPTDLRQDGNLGDTVLFYNPFAQQQFRPGFISRVKWNIDNQELVLGFHYERGDLHEWRNYTRIDPNTGVPVNYWAGYKDGITGSNGAIVYNQNQETVTTTVRPFLEDTVHLLNDQLVLNFGMQFPIVKREGENRLPLALRTAGGQVAPVNPSIEQQKFMPSMGALYNLDTRNAIFGSIAQTFRATDNAPMYQPGANLSAIQPETAIDSEVGYRFAGETLVGSVSLYNINYENREQSLFDVNVNNTVSKNIGSVNIRGIELEVGSKPVWGFSFFGSGSINDSKIKNNILVGVAGAGNLELPTQGRQLTDLPKFSLAAQARYEEGPFRASLQAKYTGRRYSTLVNDESAAGFTVVNFATGYTLPFRWSGIEKMGIELNIDNLLNKKYLGAVNFANNTNATNGIPGSAPTYFQGAPLFASVKLKVEF